jgi:hypothetical protein
MFILPRNAQEFFNEWFADLNLALRAGEFEHPAVEAHFAKHSNRVGKCPKCNMTMVKKKQTAVALIGEEKKNVPGYLKI